tara:strand:+ start:146 stop:415 length:270 start_codon:yes stop_codon:yes gene_type:complete
MDLSKITSMLFPVMVAAISWMINSVTTMQGDLIDIRSKMPSLISPQGVPTDSPISAEARGKLKEELNNKINELHVQVMILQEREKARTK